MWFFETSPIRVEYQPLESFSSLLMRTAVANRLKSLIAIRTTLIGSKEYRSPGSYRYLFDHAPVSLEQLPSILGCSLPTLRATTFSNLVERFGHLATPRQTGAFLSGSLAMNLRYCPRCLAEHKVPFYQLPWRFNSLVGCAVHRCRLLDTCPKCHQSIPLFEAPFLVGYCPRCHGDLRLGPQELLSDDDYERARLLTEDLIFLLASYNEPIDLNLRRQILQQQMALLQRAMPQQYRSEGLEEQNVEATGWVTSNGYLRYTGSLRWYMDSLGTLGMSFRTFLDAKTLQEHELLLKAAHISPPPLSDELNSLLGSVTERIGEILKQQKNQKPDITRQEVVGLLRLPLVLLKRYPQIQQVLSKVPRRLAPQIRERMEQQEADLLRRLPEALARLEYEQRPYTQLELSHMLQVSYFVIRNSPQIRQALKERCQALKKSVENISLQGEKVLPQEGQSDSSSKKPRRVKKKKYDEEVLLRSAQDTIAQLQAQGKAVTGEAVAELMGMKLNAFRRYLKTRDLMHELRDQEILLSVQQARTALQEQGELVTVTALAKAVGLGKHTLYNYPRTREELACIVSSNAQQLQRSLLLREEELLTHIDNYAQQCVEEGRQFVAAHLERELGVSASILLWHPRTRERLIQISSLKKKKNSFE